jgi:hypothetical protein
MGEQGLSYEEYLAQVKQQREDDRARFEGREGDGRPRVDLRSGHPLDNPLPGTENPSYDRLEARRQVHGPAAAEAAGFERRALETYRTKLDADPYGPRHHRLRADGSFEPVPPADDRRT